MCHKLDGCTLSFYKEVCVCRADCCFQISKINGFCFVYLIWTALQGLVLKKRASQGKKQKRKGNRRSPNRKQAWVEKGKKALR